MQSVHRHQLVVLIQNILRHFELKQDKKKNSLVFIVGRRALIPRNECYIEMKDTDPKHLI